MRNCKKVIWIVGLAVTLGIFALVACSPASDPKADGDGSTTPVAEIPEGQGLEGVVLADQWKDIYPNEYASYEMNKDNTAKVDYLAENPSVVTLYSGMAFAKDYMSAEGHPYTLQDVGETKRVNHDQSDPKATLANCLTCKSPEMTALVNAQGDSVYQKYFDDVYVQLSEPVSCYNCHENDPQTLTVTHQYLNNALGADKGQVPLEDQVCGQCHNL